MQICRLSHFVSFLATNRVFQQRVVAEQQKCYKSYELMEVNRVLFFFSVEYSVCHLINETTVELLQLT